jgi:hypothetical protein
VDVVFHILDRVIYELVKEFGSEDDPSTHGFGASLVETCLLDKSPPSRR